MLANLRSLKETSAVIAPAWYADKEGNTFDNKTIYPRISEASPVPVFGTSSANLGYGIIGGKVNSGSIQGKLAAHYALRILSGNMTTKDLPINAESHNHYIFDYRQLDRFAIDEKLLPPESDIFYRPFSFYRTYRPLVLGVIGVFCLFVLMIVLLLINIRRLRWPRDCASLSANLFAAPLSVVQFMKLCLLDFCYIGSNSPRPNSGSVVRRSSKSSVAS